jgi:hypothetical protein
MHGLPTERFEINLIFNSIHHDVALIHDLDGIFTITDGRNVFHRADLFLAWSD